MFIMGIKFTLEQIASAFNRGILSRESLWSMSCLRKQDTGLPVNIWVDDGQNYLTGKHGRRIKFQPDKGDRPRTRNFTTMTLENNPRVIGKHSLSGWEIKQLEDFVVRNKEALEQLSDMEISIFEFKDLMK